MPQRGRSAGVRADRQGDRAAQDAARRLRGSSAISSLQITFVRHGESEANVQGVWQGQGDAPLSALGEAQAAAIAERLRDHRFDRIACSDLSRAAETAAAIAQFHALSPLPDPAWREMDIGRWEGLSDAQLAARFPAELAALGRGEEIAIGGGETWTQLVARGRQALHDLCAALSEGEHALVVAHGAMIAALVGALLGIPRRRPQRLGNLHNTAITTLRWEGEAVTLDRYNDALHVAPISEWAQKRLQRGATVFSIVSEGAPPAGRLHFVVTPKSREEAEAEIFRLHREHPGQSVSLQLPAEALAALCDHLLGAPIALRVAGSRSMATTHLLCQDRILSLADLCVRLP